MSAVTETADMASLLRLSKKRETEIAEHPWLSVGDEHTAPVPANHDEIVATRLADNRSVPAFLADNPENRHHFLP